MRANVHTSFTNPSMILPSPLDATKNTYIKKKRKKKLKPSQRNSNIFQIFTDHGFGNTAKLFALN